LLSASRSDASCSSFRIAEEDEEEDDDDEEEEEEEDDVDGVENDEDDEDVNVGGIELDDSGIADASSVAWAEKGACGGGC
jgi:hypothetical protein